MIQPPTPQQYALVAKMIQGAIPPRQTQNPYVLQQGAKVLPEVPDPSAHGDWSYSQPWVNIPTVVRPGYRPTPGQAVVMEDDGQGGVPQAPAFSDTLTGHGPPIDPGFNISSGAFTPTTLPAATKSTLYSHRQALVQRFMRNARGVRK